MTARVIVVPLAPAMVVMVADAWALMPVLGIAGVGVVWLGAQTLRAIASLPPTRRSASR